MGRKIISFEDLDSLSIQARQLSSNLLMITHEITEGEEWNADITYNALTLISDQLENMANRIDELYVPRDPGKLVIQKEINKDVASISEILAKHDTANSGSDAPSVSGSAKKEVSDKKNAPLTMISIPAAEVDLSDELCKLTSIMYGVTDALDSMVYAGHNQFYSWVSGAASAVRDRLQTISDIVMNESI